MSVPVFSTPVALRLESVLPGRTRTCVFVGLDSVSAPVSHCSTEAIRSVTHLVLALANEDWHLKFEPKGADRTSPARLPPARFSWSAVLLPQAPALASACVHRPCAHPATGGTRKRSVPGRVHSVSKSCGSRCAAARCGANPLLTHGTVESPAKLSLRHYLESARAAASNQSPRRCVQHLSLANGCSHKLSAS